MPFSLRNITALRRLINSKLSKARMSNTPIELKGSSFTLSVVHLHDANPEVIRQALEDKIAQAPAFLRHATTAHHRALTVMLNVLRMKLAHCAKLNRTALRHVKRPMTLYLRLLTNSRKHCKAMLTTLQICKRRQPAHKGKWKLFRPLTSLPVLKRTSCCKSARFW